MRLNEFIKRYVNGELYTDCLITKNKEYLIEVKKGIHTLEEARELALFLTDETVQIKKEYMDTHEVVIDKECEDILNQVLLNVMRYNFVSELGVGCCE
jgi:stress response protein YsnF